MSGKNELDILLNELRGMKEEERKAHLANNVDTWSKIGRHELAELGFSTEEELKEWILSNPYANI